MGFGQSGFPMFEMPMLSLNPTREWNDGDQQRRDQDATGESFEQKRRPPPRKARVPGRSIRPAEPVIATPGCTLTNTHGIHYSRT
jgi:hypothetical protein